MIWGAVFSELGVHVDQHMTLPVALQISSSNHKITDIGHWTTPDRLQVGALKGRYPWELDDLGAESPL